MVKLVLNGCAHRAGKTWLREPDGRVHLTCLACYERITVSAYDERRTADVPIVPGQCAHEKKEALIQLANRDARFKAAPNYTDVICLQCGCVLRHPDGKGAWEEVIWNGYVIPEQP